MTLPGQVPDFDAYGAVEEVYSTLQTARNTIDGIQAELRPQIVKPLAAAQGTVAGMSAYLTSLADGVNYQARGTIEGIANDVKTQAESLMIESRQTVNTLAPFLPVTGPTPTDLTPAPPIPPGSPPPPNGGAQRSQVGPAPQPTGVLPPAPAPAPVPTISPPPPTPIIPPPRPDPCAGVASSIPWGQGPYDVFTYQTQAGLGIPVDHVQIVPAGQQALTPPGAIGWQAVGFGVTESDLPGLILSLTGCTVVAPQAPPAPPGPPPGPEPGPEPAPTPEPAPAPTPEPGPVIPPPEGCGITSWVLPECYYWLPSCAGGFGLWFDPASCTMYRVDGCCDPNTGCPPRDPPWLYVGAIGIRPANACVILGVVNPAGEIVTPPPPPPPPPPPTPAPAPGPQCQAVDDPLSPTGRSFIRADTGEQCPVEPPPPGGDQPYPDFNRLDVCKSLDAWRDILKDEKIYSIFRDSGLWDAFGSPTTPHWSREISEALTQLSFGQLRDLYTYLTGGTLGPIIAQAIPTFGSLVNATSGPNAVERRADQIAAISRAALESVYRLYVGFNKSPSGYAGVGTYAWGILNLITPLEVWLGLDFRGIRAYFVKWYNYAVQTNLPTGADANFALTNGSIDNETWECWQRLNGNYVEPARAILQGGRAKPNIGEVIQLERRGLLEGSELQQRKKQAGVMFSRDYELIYSLTTQIPVVGDIIRFMTRDAEDDALVKQFGMDDEFELKYKGRLKEWAHQQGITDLQMKYEWRSHWKIPSPTQLYTMNHWLRHKDPKSPVYVDLKMVKDALSQDDVLPFWQDRLLEVAYLPINRTTAMQAYLIDAINEQQLREATWKEGYSDADTDLLMDLSRRQKARRKADEQNLPTVATALRRYQNGSIIRAVAKEWIIRRGYTEPDAERAIVGREEEMDSDKKERAVAAVRERYRHGEYTQNDAMGELANIGLDVANAGRLTDSWSELRSIRSKMITSWRLCKYFKAGLINADDYWNRLTRLGYTNKDSDLIVAQCKDEILRAQLKAAIAAANAAGKRNGKPRR